MVGGPTLDARKVARARTLSLLIVALLSAGIGVTWWHQRGQWSESVASQVDLAADQAAMRLGDYIHARLLATGSLAESDLAMAADEAFVAEALIIEREFGGFQAINRVAASGVIELVTPEADNRIALGGNVSQREHARGAFEATRRTGRPHMTDALELLQGGRGFAAYFPIHDGPHAGDFVNGVFRIHPIVETALRGRVLEGYALALVDDAGETLVVPSDAERADAEDDARPTSSATIELLDRRWTLRVWPRDALWAQMQAGRPDAVFLFALLLVGLVAWLVYVQRLREILRDHLAEERRELQRRLETTSKMESLGRLAGGVAHDFNNILTVVVGSAGLVRRATPDNPRVTAAVEAILDATSRASDITRQLLSFARQSPTPVERLDLNEQLRSLRRLLERLTPEKVTLTLSLAAEPLFVEAATSHLSQVFVNLVVNAVDAMPTGGLLAISTRREESDVVVEVEDTGTGMDSATRNRIFEPFFTTKAEGEGTGLGLATVYGIVESYGGRIHVRSEPGRGTTFQLRLPEKRDP